MRKALLAFEKQASKDNSGYWMGSRLSLFDIQLHCLITFFDDQESVQKALDGCGALKAIYEKVQQTPQIKKWLDERPKTMF